MQVIRYTSLNILGIHGNYFVLSVSAAINPLQLTQENSVFERHHFFQFLLTMICISNENVDI
jgi:hypothetical protein